MTWSDSYLIILVVSRKTDCRRVREGAERPVWGLPVWVIRQRVHVLEFHFDFCPLAGVLYAPMRRAIMDCGIYLVGTGIKCFQRTSFRARPTGTDETRGWHDPE